MVEREQGSQAMNHSNTVPVSPNKSFKRTAPTGAASHYRAGWGPLRSVAAPAVRLTPRYAYSEMFLVEFGVV